MNKPHMTVTMYNPSFPIALKMPSIPAIRDATRLHTPIGANLGSKRKQYIITSGPRPHPQTKTEQCIFFIKKCLQERKRKKKRKNRRISCWRHGGLVVRSDLVMTRAVKQCTQCGKNCSRPKTIEIKTEKREIKRTSQSF